VLPTFPQPADLKEMRELPDALWRVGLPPLGHATATTSPTEVVMEVAQLNMPLWA
jgi:hypothetical protein